MTLLLHPRTQPSLAWQFTGQQFADWPTWVQAACKLVRVDGVLALRHERRSGAQIVYIGEWLVKDLDGEVVFYTDAEMHEEFVGI